MLPRVGDNILIAGCVGKLREEREGQGRCEWLDAHGDLQSKWLPVDLIPRVPTAEEQERQRVRDTSYDPFA